MSENAIITGIEAYDNGDSYESNPFEPDTWDWERWNKGWLVCRDMHYANQS